LTACLREKAYSSPAVSGSPTIEAGALFERLLSLRNDVGPVAEEYDPHARKQLGNFPQAFSHVALIRTGFNLCDVSPVASKRATDLGVSE
jgi:GH15 family glucan-1,4-alpha-glucosidase